MKTSYLLLCLALFLFACEGENVAPKVAKPVTQTPPKPVTDTKNPSVFIINQTGSLDFSVIGRSSIIINAIDDVELESVKAVVTEPDNTNPKVIFDQKYEKEDKQKKLNVTFSLAATLRPLPQDVSSKSYKMVVTAKDRVGKMAKDSIAFTIHAPVYFKVDFVRETTSSIANFLDWYGYSELKDREMRFKLYFLLKIDKDYDEKISEAEWKRFVKDFNFTNQSWSVWDMDKDGILNDLEFYKGLDRLGLFKEWDVNKDGDVSDDEFAGGVFDSWDDNKDTLLTKNEYEERYIYYKG